MLISSTLHAQGHPSMRRQHADVLPAHYRPDFINADTDLGEVARLLSTARTGRLCLFGPPGTGKTAYGHWLAQHMDVPLHVRRASDMLGAYLGESEKNIAQAFADAQADGGVLLIDEVDSFLQNRRGAERHWEVSQVNEMLTQMEAFSGVFIASTNLMDQLDPAVLRRFDLKVRFNPLRSEQAAELLQHHCRLHGLPAPDAADLQRLRTLTQLTPGDYAAVQRQSRLRPLTSASAWVTALEAECALKPKAHRGGMGFV
jgi:SpoVK/Ycf46/Vps4 family AAA+-type ATPase